jgi:hypothetical protein
MKSTLLLRENFFWREPFDEKIDLILDRFYANKGGGNK